MNCSEFDSLLDLYIDGTLDEARMSAVREHTAACESCRAKLASAEQLREILSHLDDDIEVPLPAQAAWRKAVREEAKRGRMKRIYRFCSAAAAVCVLAVGVTAVLKSNVRSSVQDANGVVVETDGVADTGVQEDEAILGSSGADDLVYTDRIVHAENAEEAHGYLMDLVEEYGCTVAQEEQEGQTTKVYVQVSGENAEDFVAAVDALSDESDSAEYAADSTAENVGICVTITQD